MIHRAHFDLYISSCDKNGGIYKYRITKAKPPKELSFTPMDRPMYMALANNKMYVLLRAPFENTDSGLAICNINFKGVPKKPSEIKPTKGAVAAHLAIDGEEIYAVNYISGNVIKFPDTVVTHSGSGLHPQRQESAHTHFVSTTPDGQYVFVTDLGVDKIFVYHKNLTPKSEVSLPCGHGPRHLAFHKDGRHVFCVNELQSTVSVLEYSDGILTLLDTVSVLPQDFKGESTTAAIRCIKNTVYVSNRGHDSISVLSFDENRLTLCKTISTYGKSPRDFWIHDSLIIAANELSDEVTFVSIEQESLVGKISVKSPNCVIVT